MSILNSAPSAMAVPRSCKVAVVGAGAGGLVSARELQRQGHRVVVFEKANRVGGTWIYDPRCETDLLGLDPRREIIHSSLYSSLRTNLPRKIMGFLDYSFRTRENGDPRAFPAHGEVLNFLEDFARDFNLVELIRFRTEVVHISMLNKDEWVVKFRSLDEDSMRDLEEEAFEAVVVCNGHHTEPRIAEFPGIDRWPGIQVHSHNYRIPEPFKDQVVVLIGSGPSAHDISRDISKFAKEVHLSVRSKNVEAAIKSSGHDNIWVHSMIQCAHGDGMVMFQDGTSLLVDIILHCTGYKYHFPFLETNGAVGVDDNCVGPLYMHVFPPSLAPWLSFVGIQWQVIPFLAMELQSKWIAHVLSGKVCLPSEEEMMESVKDFYLRMDETGIPKRYTHRIFPHDFEYLNWLAALVGLPAVEEWRKQMYDAAINGAKHHHQYRDDWDEE